MKRSVINAYIKDAEAFFQNHHFALPPWAHWSPSEWDSKNCEAIFQGCLGWDLTDFGSGDFERRGLLLFTLRNGNPAEPQKTYAEKIMIVGEGQETPRHFHWDKTEDIINRGGGILVIELWNSDENEQPLDTSVTVLTDGTVRNVQAGEPLRLSPGESITLNQGLYHRFYAENGRVLAGEVSKTNDDANDNRFFENNGRFPKIDEDEAPWRLLVGDYERFGGQKS